jgi:hypothetical protein
MHIEKDVTSQFITGTVNCGAIGRGPAIPVKHQSLSPVKGIQFKAGVNNSGSIFIGGSNVNGTITSDDCGLEMEAGDQIFLPLEDPKCAYIHNATANDACHYIIM